MGVPCTGTQIEAVVDDRLDRAAGEDARWWPAPIADDYHRSSAVRRAAPVPDRVVTRIEWRQTLPVEVQGAVHAVVLGQDHCLASLGRGQGSRDSLLGNRLAWYHMGSSSPCVSTRTPGPTSNS